MRKGTIATLLILVGLSFCWFKLRNKDLVQKFFELTYDVKVPNYIKYNKDQVQLNFDDFFTKCDIKNADQKRPAIRALKTITENSLENNLFSPVYIQLILTKKILYNLPEKQKHLLGCHLVHDSFTDDYLKWTADLLQDIASKLGYQGHSLKPTLRIRLQNLWPTASLDQFSLIKDIFAKKFTPVSVEDEHYDVIIESVFGTKPVSNKNSYKIFFSGEPFISNTQGYDLSLGFDYLLDANYMRFPLYYLYFANLIDTRLKRDDKCNPKKPYFACYLVSNRHGKERNKLFRELSKYKDIASGGKYLNNIGHLVKPEETYNFLSQCKFVIAYENRVDYPGYISEKIFMAYLSGSIPIYSSHPSVLSDVNTNAFVSRQKFDTDEEMIDYIKELDQNDEKYCHIWNQPIIINPERNYSKQEEILSGKIWNGVKANDKD